MLWGVYLSLYPHLYLRVYSRKLFCSWTQDSLPTYTHTKSVYRYKSFSQSDVKYLVNWYRNHNRFAFLRSSLGGYRYSCYGICMRLPYMLVRNNLSCHLSRETYLYTFSYLAVICLHIGWKANTIDCRPICVLLRYSFGFWLLAVRAPWGWIVSYAAKYIMFKWWCRLCITCADDFVRKIYDNIVL